MRQNLFPYLRKSISSLFVQLICHKWVRRLHTPAGRHVIDRSDSRTVDTRLNILIATIMSISVDGHLAECGRCLCKLRREENVFVRQDIWSGVLVSLHYGTGYFRKLNITIKMDPYSYYIIKNKLNYWRDVMFIKYVTRLNNFMKLNPV